ncbi:MAG: mitochondrial fission ELM1 family protein [Pseudoxanthomonas sp.]
MEQRSAFPMDSTQLWTLTDGHAGNRRQAEALAGALGLGPAQDWLLQPRLPWSVSAPRNFAGAQHAFGTDFAAALEHPPRLAIGCGRQAALATRLLHARGGQVLQILDPRIDPRHWDLVVAPEHDGLTGANVITLAGSLNPVDDDWLARAREAFAVFAQLPRPRTALLLGGASTHARFDANAFQALADQLDVVLAREGGSVLATTSRRTPADLVAALRARYGKTPGLVWCDGTDGANPYDGLLAWADRIVCSPDSVNMVSEACATAAPVFVFDPVRVSGRPRRFLDALLARGRIRVMDTTLAPFPTEPLRETARVAALVKARLSL